ncbi:ferredoxin [Streptomyces glebosus]|uniref:Ferredoxin n=2 Tax=Streptomyces TaxID=1883 RepID=A0A640STM8_9ACTN|nr:ferredoxin [Streptomyces glebosus]GFE13621.1 ferredoxin [Streptomyces glebosus]GHG69067.1 ferredoxin [Streptomyces glebosus]
MEIDADRDVCVGAGQCAVTAPELFDQDEDDGLVLVLRQPGQGDEEAARKAVSLCPARALLMREARPGGLGT